MSTPERFGPYVLERFVAQGGMAEVFQASRADGRFPAPLCVKRILPAATGTEEFVSMFRDEAQLAVRLVHPNIVRVFDYGDVDGRLYMAMEYIDGTDVATVMRRLRARDQLLGVAHAVKIGIELLKGLHHAHVLADGGIALELVHRDVSPQNVLIARSGAVKVADFGIAKAVGRETHTKTGLIKGKIAYMAPEQALGQHLDARADQFAAGIVIWEMLTGLRLFQEKSELLTFEKIIRHETARPSTLRQGIPGAVDAAVLRALQKSPDSRFSDCLVFAKALHEALAQLGGAGAADLGPVMDYVLNDGSDAPTEVRRTPSVARLPTGNISPLPLPSTSIASPPSTQPTPQRARPAPEMRRGGLRTVAADAALPESQRGTGSATAALPSSGNASGNALGASLGSSPGRTSSQTAQLPAGIEMAPTPGAFVPHSPPPEPAAPSWGARLSVLALGAVLGALVTAGVMSSRGARAEAACFRPSSDPAVVEQAFAQLLKAQLALDAGDQTTALRFVEGANQLSGSAKGHLLLGQLKGKAGDTSQSLFYFRCVVDQNPTSPEADIVDSRVRDLVR